MKNIVLAVFLLTNINIALAESPNYSYVEAIHTVSDWDARSGTYKEWMLSGSHKITEDLYISGLYSQGEHREQGAKSNHYALDIGYFSNLGVNSTWHTSLGYMRKNSEYTRYPSTDADLLIWKAGIRHSINDPIELNIGMMSMYDDLYGTRTRFNVGALYNTDSGLGIKLGLIFNARAGTSIMTGIRYTY